MAPQQQALWLKAWYGRQKWVYLLLPLMCVFFLLSSLRRIYLQKFAQQQLPIPVIVVGNISVGGTGKTPLLIALVKHLQARGFNPGVISRGYGGKPPRSPFILDAHTNVAQSGDEPLSIFQQTACLVCVDADRVAAARALERAGCDIVLSDDGLQHYRLGRMLEIAVVDGQRGFGNGFCLPVGPLREPVSRLQTVDLVVINSAEKPLAIHGLQESFSMAIAPHAWFDVKRQRPFELNHFAPGTQVHAVAGIGNPERFYATLAKLQLEVIAHDFPDHYAYQAADLEFAGQLPLVMTAKDAVKCQSFAQPDWYYLAVGAVLPDYFWQAFDAKLAAALPQ